MSINTSLAGTASSKSLVRMVAGAGAGLVLLLASTACAGGQPPEPTPDPFAGLSRSADQAFREGLKLYEEGHYRDALNAFERARILSPDSDPRIQQFVEKARSALAPTATPAAPTATPLPATPTAVPLVLNPAQPDTDLGARYFGDVHLSIVPGRAAVAPPQQQFYFEDQVGLYIEGLDQRLRIPFTMRIFDLDTGQAIASVAQDSVPPSPVPLGAQSAGSPAPAGAPPRAVAATGASAATAPVAGTQDASATRLVRFWDRYVWYHAGGEAPGRYRLELYANGTLTNAFDYTVGNVPVAIAATATPEPAVATPGVAAIPAADVPPPPPPVAAIGPASPRVVAPPPTETPVPTPTATPTPAAAATAVIGGLPAGLDTFGAADRVYVADASGIVWTVDRSRPTLAQPFRLGRLPVDLAVDQGSGTVYVATRSDPAVMALNGQTGQVLNTIPLPADPGDVQLDPALGLLYVVLPERQEVARVDVRAGRLVGATSGLPQVTALALDPQSHTLYASHLTGQLSILDARDGRILNRLSASSAGLSGLAAAHGYVYAINTPLKQLVVLNQGTLELQRFSLPDYPGAIGAGDDSGAAYVLAVRQNAILRVDPTDGSIVGKALLPDRSGRFGTRFQQQDFQGLRARLAIGQADETVYLTQPEAGLLSVVSQAEFPPLAREIPRPDSAPQEAAAPAAVPTPLALAGSVATAAQDAGAGNAPAPLAATPAPAPAPRPTPAAPAATTPGQRPAARVSAQQSASNALDWAVPGGRFFTQTGGVLRTAASRGFALTDEQGISFWSAYERLGGPDLLGYPMSNRFQWRGFVVQLTQRGLLQWWPRIEETRLVNLLDELHNAGLDARLLSERAIPPQEAFAGEQGLTFDEVKQRRLRLLDADAAIRARYFAAPDPVQLLGLPTSHVVDLGPVVAVRTQRGALQRWKRDTAWARAGEVTVALAGDIAREYGLFGTAEAPFAPVESASAGLPPAHANDEESS